jgi:hypothetical protein
MLKRLALIGVTAAASALTFVACGDEGPGSINCTTDNDCQLGEICHPNAGVCVRTCSSSSDCPTEAKTCKTTPATGSQMICTCATDELCEQELGAGTVCSDRFEVCTETEDVTCSTTAPQPDSCRYGEFCVTGGTCQAVSAPTCQNFTTSVHGLHWSPSSDSGPIIYSISQVGGFAPNAQFCQANQKLARMQVRAYRTSNTFPTSNPQDLLNELHYVKVDGTEAAGVEKPFVFPSTYTVTNNGRNVDFELGFCPPDTLNQFTAGLHFVSGNEVCIVVQ